MSVEKVAFTDDENGKTDIFYIISNETGTWAFTVQNDKDMIERLDEVGLKQLLDSIFIDANSKMPEQTQITTKVTPKFCTNCGTPVNTGSKFCANCGIMVV